MKKSNFLLIPLVVLAAVMGLMLSNANNVEAANNECSTGYTKTTYMDKISYNISDKTVNFTGARGLNYTVSYDSSETRNSVDSNGNFSFTVPDEYADGKIIVTFYLTENDNVCDSGVEVGGIEFYLDSAGYNQLYSDSLCVNYRNKWSNNSTMKEAVPYCFTEYVSVQYSYSEVSSWISEAERLYDLAQNGSSNIVQDPSYTNVKNVKETEKLVCDAFSTNNYETMHKYSHKETESVDNCTVTCKEEIEVNFSDPVATQAGMCFQYLIEIKSKVTCDSYYTAPRPSKPGVCVPSAYCRYSSSSTSDKGGPSEDFDECVNQCDGGEYTQKCIDSCYTKVYENDNEENVINTQSVFKELGTSLLTYDLNSTMFEGTDNIQLVANGCIDPKTANYNQAEALYNQKLRDPGGYYKITNGKTVWVKAKKSESSCPSDIGYYYFRSVAATRNTMHELRGDYSQGWGNKTYAPNDIGILYRTLRDDVSDVCTDDCKWVNKCGSNTVLTQYLADQQYNKALQEWEKKKIACEQKAATCTNETTDYEIVVDNIDNDSDSSDDEETFSSSQKLNSTTVDGDFPDMVILTDGSCEDGESDPWHYHNIITFPGTWINNKTGQPVHSMDPDREDFYTYVGNQYCTKLNSIPINTAWYDWKVNQGGDSSALTDSQKQEIEDSITMNINGHIENYGYFGWNFDVSCFYAVGETDTECTPDDPNWPTCEDPSCPETDPNYPECDGGNGGETENAIDAYEYRSISLDNLFPNSVTPTSSDDVKVQASNLINEVESLRGNDAVLVANETREVGFNWTCAATNLENPDYIVQPVTLINRIQELGDSIYSGDEYLDYHIVLTPETMQKVREYNDDYNSYVQPTGQTAEEIGLILNAGTNKTAGITVYRSYLLHEVLNSSELLKEGLIGCNNEGKGDNECLNDIDTSTACYNEYMTQSAVLKGAS